MSPGKTSTSFCKLKGNQSFYIVRRKGNPDTSPVASYFQGLERAVQPWKSFQVGGRGVGGGLCGIEICIEMDSQGWVLSSLFVSTFLLIFIICHSYVVSPIRIIICLFFFLYFEDSSQGQKPSWRRGLHSVISSHHSVPVISKTPTGITSLIEKNEQ